jgi:hypothetical protein
VDNALSIVAEIEHRNTRGIGSFAGCGNERLATGYAGFIGASGKSVDNMIHAGKYLFGVADFSIRGFEPFQGYTSGAFVNEYPIDVQQIGIVTEVGNSMLIPELLKNGSTHVFSPDRQVEWPVGFPRI